jgi:hypothetical protein
MNAIGVTICFVKKEGVVRANDPTWIQLCEG